MKCPYCGKEVCENKAKCPKCQAALMEQKKKDKKTKESVKNG